MGTFSFEKVSAGANAIVDVIFVHGLTGDAKETWKCETTKEFWPLWLTEAAPNISIYTLGYPASLFDSWAREEMDIFERSIHVLEHLAAKGVGTRPIVFVSHSLGGLLTKVLIRTALDSGNSDYERIANAIRMVVFLGTPHNGAYLAEILSAIPGTSKHVALLANQTGFLNDLNYYYRRHAEKTPALVTKVYYEKHRTKVATVVSSASADPGVTGVTPIPIDKDHLGICKPSSKEDTVFLSIQMHLRKLLDGIPVSNSLSKEPSEYLERSQSDRRDLFEKLLDAQREHEYLYANDAQNRFARKFIKSGLLTAAKDDQELLLTEVETRFFSHVFHPLICNDRPDAEIRSAIQERIVDPLTTRDVGGTRFTAKDVVSAIYYLTEQCFIRWDKPA